MMRFWTESIIHLILMIEVVHLKLDYTFQINLRSNWRVELRCYSKVSFEEVKNTTQ